MIATSRAMVLAFFESLSKRGLGSVIFLRIPLSAESPAEHHDELAQASVAVVDVGYEPAHAVRFCKELSQRHPGLAMMAVLCCPHSIDAWQLQALLESGVGGVVDLHATPDEAVSCVRSVARGNAALHVHLWRGAGSFGHDPLVGRDGVSEMRMRLLELLSLGLPEYEIGTRLHLSPHTVKHHVEDLRHELGLRNRIELAAWAGRHGFYRPERKVPAASLPSLPPPSSPPSLAPVRR